MENILSKALSIRKYKIYINKLGRRLYFLENEEKSKIINILGIKYIKN
jgi:hypothetical protein